MKYWDLRVMATGKRYNITKPYTEGIDTQPLFYELPDGTPAEQYEAGARAVGEWVLCEYSEEEIREQKIKNIQKEYFPLFDGNALIAGRIVLNCANDIAQLETELLPLKEYDDVLRAEYTTKLSEV